jgi:hypothetical protein
LPFILNANARLICAHGGQVMVIPKQVQVLVGGAPALAEPDLLGSPIVGCPIPPTPATKPCTTVVSSMPGGASMKVMVGGRPALLDTFQGLTDGVPPGNVMVVFAGQTAVMG